jgi:uncharacterized Fe-S cluster protein YjdI
MPSQRRVYRGKQVDVSFDAGRCRHAQECLHGLGAVFDAERRPWILPDAADADAVIEVVARCPTGALRTDPRGPEPEVASRPTTVEVIPGGPLLIRGDLDIAGELELRAALCSCGTTANAPYCDGSGTCAGWPGPVPLQRS